MIARRQADEIEVIRRAGAIVAEVLRILAARVKPGITTQELDILAEESIRGRQAKCAFKGYRGFPSAACVSVNEEVVHGIPSSRVIKEGDIVSIDLGVELSGFFADAAVTVGVGKISAEASKLLEVTRKALTLGLKQARPGNHVSDISYAVQNCVESQGFSVVRQFVGHGIGRKLHEDPEIPNFGRPHRGERLEAGMVLAIEPMVNAGTWEVAILDNGWTAVTADSALSAHFEHTVAVTEKGPEILTV
ncbi:MAG: type I methionyl aminopeptidase [Candidatus Omnitrophica bacterium]|nr:type I methionyl aminopeptidase [Candidatus Omnitrophota bacterium]